MSELHWLSITAGSAHLKHIQAALFGAQRRPLSCGFGRVGVGGEGGIGVENMLFAFFGGEKMRVFA